MKFSLSLFSLFWATLSFATIHTLETQLLLFQEPLNSTHLQKIKELIQPEELTPFSPHRSSYFSRLYSLKISTQKLRLIQSQLEQIAALEKIEQPRPVQFFFRSPQSESPSSNQ